MTNLQKIHRSALAEMIVHKKTRTISMIILIAATVFTLYGFLDNEGYVIFGLILYCISALPLYALLTEVFRDMHDRPTADVQMALPLSSLQRFNSKLLTICYIWLFPFLASATLSLIASEIYAVFSNENLFDETYEFLGPIIIYLLALSIALFIASVTIFVESCVGSKSESKYMPILVMGIFSGLPAALIFLMRDKFADIQTNDSFPLPLRLWTFTVLGNLDLDPEKEYPKIMLCFIISILISGALIFATSFIYKSRDAKRVGNPIVFAPFLEVIMICISFFTFIASSSSIAVIFAVSGLIGTTILRIIVTRKNFRASYLVKWTIYYFIYFLVYIVFMFIACQTGGFGAVYNKPKELTGNEYAVSVTIRTNYDYSTLFGYDRSEYKELLDFNDIVYVTGNAEKKNLETMIDDTIVAASRQNHQPGYFRYAMFNGSFPNSYRCYISVRNYNSYSENFTASFILKQDEVNKFRKAMESDISVLRKRSDSYDDERYSTYDY